MLLPDGASDKGVRQATGLESRPKLLGDPVMKKRLLALLLFIVPLSVLAAPAEGR